MTMIIDLGEKELERMVLQQLMEALPKIVHSAIHKGVSYTTTRRTRNGVTEPARNGKCGQIWQELDLLIAAGVTPTLNQIQRVSVTQGWNTNNANAEYYAWRRFHKADIAGPIAA